MNNNCKFVLGFALGAAVTAAIGYAIYSGKAEEWISAMGEKTADIKEDLDVFFDKVEASVEAVKGRKG